MKYLIICFFLFLSVMSCESEKTVEDSIQVNTKEVDIETSAETISMTPEVVKGEVITYYSNGKIKTEGWNNAEGKRDGVWYSYFESGIKWSESSYKNGLKDGHSIVFYPNGNTRYVGDYKNDKKTGPWTFYKESGEIDTEEVYD